MNTAEWSATAGVSSGTFVIHSFAGSVGCSHVAIVGLLLEES